MKNAYEIFQNSEKPKNGLPKRWQKFDDLIYLPVGVELTEEELDQVLQKYKVSRIAQQEIIDDDDIRSPKAKILRQGLIFWNFTKVKRFWVLYIWSLSGGESSLIIQRENGVKYQYDLAKNMFSRGNISEKVRFANFDVTNEIIIGKNLISSFYKVISVKNDSSH